MAKVEAFLSLERTVVAALNKSFSPTGNQLVARLKAALDKRDFAEAYFIADRINMNGVVEDVRDRMEELAVSCLLFGAGNVSSVRGSGYATGRLPLPDVLPRVLDQMTVMVEEEGTRGVQQAVRDLITAEEEKDKADQYVIKKAGDLDAMADALNAAVMGTGKAFVDIGANLTTSRLVSYGFLAEASLFNVETYQINEVLDSRTCPVCRAMHGRTFDVKSETAKLELLFKILDPKEIKSAAPWPSQGKEAVEKLKAMSSSEMQAAGFGSPPFHPLCRGLLARAGTVTPVYTVPMGGDGGSAATHLPVKPAASPSKPAAAPVEADAGPMKVRVATEAPAGPPVPPPFMHVEVDDIAKVFGMPASEHSQKALVDFWNTHIQISPTEFKKAMTGGQPGTIKAITREGGTLKVSVNFQTKAGSIMGDMTRIIDPVNKTASHDFFEINAAYQGTNIAKKVLRSQVDFYKSKGYTEVSLFANIDVGGYAWARYGFVPQAGMAWEILAGDIRRALDHLTTKGLPTAVREVVEALLDQPDTKAVWTIADMDYEFQGKKLGKLLLMDTGWKGTLALNDAETMKRFDDYVQRRA